jgi:hypothetical protein
VAERTFSELSGCLRQVRSGSHSLAIGKANVLTRERISKELLHLPWLLSERDVEVGLVAG